MSSRYNRCPLEFYNYLEELLANYTETEKTFVKEIVLREFFWQHNAEKEFVGIHSHKIIELFGQSFRWKKLEANGIIQVDKTCEIGKKTFGFRVNDEIRVEFSKCIRRNLVANSKRVDMFNGKKPVEPKTQFHDDNKNSFPDDIKEFLKAYHKVPVNVEAISEWISEQIVIGQIDTSDMIRMIDIRDRAKLGEDGFSYCPAYECRSTGRFFEKLGVQGLKKSLKRVVFRGFENLINYDIRAAQLCATKLEFDRFDIVCPKIDELLVPGRIDKICKDLKIEKALFKVAVYGIIFGGRLEPNNPFSEITKEFKRYTRDKHIAAQILEELSDELFELVGAMSDYREKLWEHEMSNGNIKKRGDKFFFRNEFGATAVFTDDSDRSRRRLCACVLQAYERNYFKAVAVLAPSNHYKLVVDMHDGVITENRIPEHVKTQCAAISKFLNAELIEKEIGE